MNVPAESMEMDVPIRVHRMRLARDSGGGGTFRGWLGRRTRDTKFCMAM
jgi:N-methylhydantoinase B